MGGLYRGASGLDFGSGLFAGASGLWSGASGLEADGGVRNLMTFTEAFDNAAWVKTRSSITANAAAAPDGTVTMDKLVEDTTAASNHNVQQGAVNPILSTSDPRCLSVYAKAAERTKFRLRSIASSGFQADFDLVAVTATGAGVFGGTAPSLASIAPVGGGIFRCAVAGTYVSGNIGLSPGFVIFLLDAAGADVYNGDGASGMLFWGAQMEVGASPSGYQAR